MHFILITFDFRTNFSFIYPAISESRENKSQSFAWFIIKRIRKDKTVKRIIESDIRRIKVEAGWKLFFRIILQSVTTVDYNFIELTDQVRHFVRR